MSKVAVVLAGGGSRGAYQIGVWQALRELNIEYQIVTGTSVGALNGALMVQNDFEIAKNLWSNLSSKDVMKVMCQDENIKNINNINNKKAWAGFLKEVIEKGGADITPLEQIVDRLVDEEKFRSSSVDFALVTVEYPSLKPLELAKKDIPDNMLAEYLLASAACFPAFQTREINGCKYIDGGYHDNLPINLALKLGAEEIIAVDLESIGLVRKVKHDFKKITVIHSSWSLGSFLAFEKDLAERNMSLGYLDTMKALGNLDGYLYSFNKDSCKPLSQIIHASVAELSAEAKEKDSVLVSALSRRLLRKMLRDFWGKTSERRPFTIARQIIMAAEYCGEAFKIDPAKAYDLQEFNKNILEAEKKLAENPIIISASISNIPKMIEEFAKQDKAHLLFLIAERLREFLQGSSKGTELLLLTTSFWKEFLGAIYLLVLKNLLPSCK